MSSIAPQEAEKAPIVVPTTEQKGPEEELALKVLQIIETYGVNYERSDESWEGLKGFLPLVTQKIKDKKPVLMLLPGFPFKAPNAVDKVLGVLPDLGEELALSHLNSMCKNIGHVYEHGAEVHICSDGLVYNDLLGVSDEDVWNYGEAVRHIAKERELHHLKFIRLWDLLDHPGPWTPEFYKTHASCIRREMVVRFRDLEFEKDMASKSTEDVRMTHAGYLKNVAKDLAHSPILTELDDEARELKVQSIAKSMMGRWRAYASALEPWESGNGYVRLSIHDSKGGSKLSMALVPQARGAIGFTPWHSAVVVELDGTYRPAHVSEVRDTHDLVSVNGQPYYYRAKTDLFDWKADGLEVEFNFLYPTGLRITAKGEFSVRDLPSRKVRKLANNFSPLLLSAFKESTDRSLLEAKGNELGKALTKHDGHTPYRILLCSSTADKPAASAMYTNSRLLFRHLPAPWTMENVQTIVASHKETGAPCLIRGDSWDGVDPSLAKMAADLMLDERVTLRYELQQGEVLITDSSLVVYSKLPDNPDSDRDLQELGFE